MSDTAKNEEFKVHDYEYYAAMRADLTKNDNEAIIFAIDVYRRHPEIEDIFQLCIGSYVCGDEVIRQVMKEELEGSMALEEAKKLVKEKELEETKGKTTWREKVGETAKARTGNSAAPAVEG